MLKDWQHSDIIASIALLVSIAASTFSFLQWRVAKRKEKADANAFEPVVEPKIKEGPWPEWFLLTLSIRNRDDIALVCAALTILKPRNVAVVTCEESCPKSRGRYGEYVFGDIPPARLAKRTCKVDVEVPAAGSMRTNLVTNGLMSNDRRHIDFLVFAKSTVRSSRDWQTLRMSLRVQRINESAPYSDIIVVTRMPATTTRTAS